MFREAEISVPCSSWWHCWGGSGLSPGQLAIVAKYLCVVWSSVPPCAIWREHQVHRCARRTSFCAVCLLITASFCGCVLETHVSECVWSIILRRRDMASAMIPSNQTPDMVSRMWSCVWVKSFKHMKKRCAQRPEIGQHMTTMTFVRDRCQHPRYIERLYHLEKCFVTPSTFRMSTC